MSSRARGKVKWFNAEKGYGFITQDNGPDLFVHYSEICGSGYRTLNAGDVVEFDITDGKKGKQASRVMLAREAEAERRAEEERRKRLEEERAQKLERMRQREKMRDEYKAAWADIRPGEWTKEDVVNLVWLSAYASVVRPEWGGDLVAAAGAIKTAAESLKFPIGEFAFFNAWDAGERAGWRAAMLAATAACKETRFEDVIIIYDTPYDHKKYLGSVEIAPEGWLITRKMEFRGKEWENYPFKNKQLLVTPEDATVSLYTVEAVYNSGGGDAYRDAWSSVTYKTGDPITTNRPELFA